jgi:hypothetical protein
MTAPANRSLTRRGPRPPRARLARRGSRHGRRFRRSAGSPVSPGDRGASTILRVPRLSRALVSARLARDRRQQ